MYHPPEQHQKEFAITNLEARQNKLVNTLTVALIIIIVVTTVFFNKSDNGIQSIVYILGLSIPIIAFVLIKVIKKKNLTLYFTNSYIEKQFYFGQSSFYRYIDLKRLEINDNEDLKFMKFYFTPKKGRKNLITVSLYENQRTTVDLILFLKSKNKSFTLNISPHEGELKNKVLDALLKQKPTSDKPV